MIKNLAGLTLALAGVSSEKGIAQELIDVSNHNPHNFVNPINPINPISPMDPYRPGNIQNSLNNTSICNSDLKKQESPHYKNISKGELNAVLGFGAMILSVMLGLYLEVRGADDYPDY